MPEKKRRPLDIYPPEFPDPLKGKPPAAPPIDDPEATSRYLAELAREVEQAPAEDPEQPDAGEEVPKEKQPRAGS